MRLHPLRIGIAMTGVGSILACGTACSGELVKAPVTEPKVMALPKAPAVHGPLPRPLLMVQLRERGKFPGDRTHSSIWVFDPAAPESGLRKVFSGPGQGQYVRFLTPLYGGYGLASGRLNVDTSEYEVVGTPPPAIASRSRLPLELEILPAGKNCRDGIYAIQEFSLSFQPKGGTWHRVIQNVRVESDFHEVWTDASWPILCPR